MTRKTKYQSGMQFGEWTLIQPSTQRTDKWLCKCSCGAEKEVYTSHMKAGKSTRCRACYGEATQTIKTTQPSEYRSWGHMIQRCTNPNNDRYAQYGGAGITVCDRWRNSFENFFEDMGKRPKGTSIDRIDNTKGYSPDNCRWATNEQQFNNMKNAITLDGIKMSRATLAKKLSIHAATVSRQLKKGLTPEDIVEKYSKWG